MTICQRIMDIGSKFKRICFMWSANLLIKRCGIARACSTTTEECRAYFKSLVLCVKCVCTISYPTKSHEQERLIFMPTEGDYMSKSERQ